MEDINRTRANLKTKTKKPIKQLKIK